MNKAIYGVLAVLMFLISVGSAVTAQEAKAPKITVSEIRHDFGKVDEGTVVTHVFEIRNAGNDTLVIEKLQPT